ncbi:hypothetical protein LCGC14_0630090 [marine sediment metagenome]|uniref:AFP-like domain-containing protein n=1 Tax=marine sediment metagenome TaxID=412755 RepID=A0A0F9R244_9ZZZZ
MKALDFCLKNEETIDCIELHSINFTNILFLKELKRFSKTIILGVGGRTLEDIMFVYNFLQKQNLIFMYGFQSFPTNYYDLKMSKIDKLKKIFNVEIGYADHTSFEDNMRYNLVEYAYLSGSRIFEMHLVVIEGEKRIDYNAAINSKTLLKIRERLENLIKIQGYEFSYTLNNPEEKYKKREKKIVAKRDIDKNEVFSEDNIWLKVSDEKSDFEQIMYKNIIGKIARHNIQQDRTLNFSDIN